ncbi:transcription factor Adf-1-like [Rhagoletis pomonella]|uniref:transcription factor Adf-1-like n=1 Tax=Rhagoletis pomonella TaxID=28610 RepID=UPI00178681EE|nr:transcription factor Adf-1-like [Rhagoletis pomonella]
MSETEVQKYPFLYNLKDEGYKNALKKEEVWLQISEVLGQEANVCKKRWKGLRDHYSRCKRAETLPSGSSASKRTRWRFYDQMSFLDNFQYCRRAWSNVSEVEESVIEVQGEEDEVHTATPCQSRRKHDMIDDDFRFFLE